MNKVLALGIFLIFPLFTFGQIVIKGTYSPEYFQNGKKSKLYYTKVGVPFSKRQYVKIDKNNQYEINLKNSKDFQHIIFSTDWKIEPQANWCKISAPLNLSQFIEKSEKIILLHDIVINETCEERGAGIQIMSKEFLKFVNTYTLDNSIYKSIRLVEDGSAFINYSENISGYINAERGRWDIDTTSKEVKLLIATQHNSNIGLFKKTEKKIILQYIEQDNSSIKLRKPD